MDTGNFSTLYPSEIVNVLWGGEGIIKDSSMEALNNKIEKLSI